MIVLKHYENLNVLPNTTLSSMLQPPASKDMGSLVHDREI